MHLRPVDSLFFLTGSGWSQRLSTSSELIFFFFFLDRLQKLKLKASFLWTVFTEV